MSMIAKEVTGSNIEKLENGVYTAISSMMIDLGIQINEKFANKQRKFIVIWNIIGEDVEINGEKLPRTISKEYGYGLGEKSNLRRDLQAWRGKPFSKEELQGFDLKNILNKPCQLQIIKEEKNGKVYNNIVSIMALPKGTTLEQLQNTSYFDFEEKSTWENWDKIPSWIREKIKKAVNFSENGLEEFIIEFEKYKNNDEKNVNDDLPF